MGLKNILAYSAISVSTLLSGCHQAKLEKPQMLEAKVLSTTKTANGFYMTIQSDGKRYKVAREIKHLTQDLEDANSRGYSYNDITEIINDYDSRIKKGDKIILELTPKNNKIYFSDVVKTN